MNIINFLHNTAQIFSPKFFFFHRKDAEKNLSGVALIKM